MIPETEEGRVVEIEFPLPPKAVSPNDSHHKAHWIYRGKAAKEYRDTCRWTVQAYLPAGWVFQKAEIEMDFYQAPRPVWDTDSARFRDVQNAIAATKALVDGIVDSGLLRGDSARFLTFGRVRLFNTKKEHQGRACIVAKVRET